MVDKTSLVVAFFVAAVLAGLFVQFRSGSPVGATKETFMQKQLGMPLSSPGIGPYDSVSLDGGVSGWMGSEPVPMGTGLPSLADDNKLMFLVGNKTDDSCCPGAFNTDTGCVCLTESDRAKMASRGGNRA
jgi:hypothetical protein